MVLKQISIQKSFKGLNKDIVRRISAKKNEPEYMLEFVCYQPLEEK